MIKKLTAQIAAVAFAGAVLSNADHIEAMVAPVTSRTTVVIDSHTNDTICWTIRFRKYRALEPRFFAWSMVHGGKTYFLPTYRPDRQPRTANTTNPATPSAFYSTCTPKPKGVGYKFALRAFARYATPHGLWDIPRYIGPVYIDGDKVDEQHRHTSVK